jgi:hypothetical protein
MTKNRIKKIHKINITYAQTFGYRTRCKYCLSGPMYSYFLMSKAMSNHILYDNKRYNDKFAHAALAGYEYIDRAVKSRDVKIYFLADPTASYTSKMPITTSKYQQNKEPFITAIECKCGKTTWSFVSPNRAHISNRKCEIPQNVNIQSLYKILL